MSATPLTATPAGDTREAVRAVDAEMFRALEHPVQLGVAELLRAPGEMSVRDPKAALQVESGGISQHLAVLRRLGVLSTRRQGTSVLYRMRDPRTFELLDIARRVLCSQHQRTRMLLASLNATQPPRPRPSEYRRP